MGSCLACGGCGQHSICHLSLGSVKQHVCLRSWQRALQSHHRGKAVVRSCTCVHRSTPRQPTRHFGLQWGYASLSPLGFWVRVCPLTGSIDPLLVWHAAEASPAYALGLFCCGQGLSGGGVSWRLVGHSGWHACRPGPSSSQVGSRLQLKLPVRGWARTTHQSVMLRLWCVRCRV